MTPDAFLPACDEERRAVWAWLEQMLSHPEGLYDGHTLAEVRDRMAVFLAAYRDAGGIQ